MNQLLKCFQVFESFVHWSTYDDLIELSKFSPKFKEKVEPYLEAKYQEQLHPPFERFNLGQIRPNSNILIIGTAGAGKSTLILDYLYQHRDIPNMTVFSLTEGMNPIYQLQYPEASIHDEYSPELIEQFRQRQMQITKQRGSSIDPRGLLILDDCLFDARDRSIQWMVMNGRFTKTTMIIALQYPISLPPKLRANIDYVFIYREPNHNIRKRLYDQYAGIFPKRDLFDQALMATGNYNWLVFDQTSTSHRLEDQVFWYKAELH